jgi:septum formation protein
VDLTIVGKGRTLTRSQTEYGQNGEPLLVLASASPRRALLLRQLGVPFKIVEPRIDERTLPGEMAEAAAERLARAKASAVAETESLPVLGADTMVVCDGRILGKPGSAQDALEMLRCLAGRAHLVVTGVALAFRGRLLSGFERTVVTFASMTAEQMTWYAGTGEGLDKAGAYHIDGVGALFVRSISGSPTNVTGLPLGLVHDLVRQAGVSIGLP